MNNILTPEDLYGLQKVLNELHFPIKHRNLSKTGGDATLQLADKPFSWT